MCGLLGMLKRHPVVIAAACFLAIGVVWIVTRHNYGENQPSLKSLLGAFAIPDGFLGDGNDLSGLEMTDPRLIAYIRSHYMELPSTEPYNLTNPSAVDYSQYGQSAYAASVLKGITGQGTFFEAGAYDGEVLSNSLYFEKTLGWKGLLVEPEPRNVLALRSKHRKAIFFSCCISGARPVQAYFECPYVGAWTATCQVKETTGNNAASATVQKAAVWCFPLYSILLAAGITDIDYMSVDLEYYELTVLSALPLDKLRVKVIQVEFSVLDANRKYNYTASDEKLSQLRNFFRTRWTQYREYKLLNIDVVFVNIDLIDPIVLPTNLTWIA